LTEFLIASNRARVSAAESPRSAVTPDCWTRSNLKPAAASFAKNPGGVILPVAVMCASSAWQSIAAGIARE
jgi:hypothetical protein